MRQVGDAKGGRGAGGGKRGGVSGRDMQIVIGRRLDIVEYLDAKRSKICQRKR